MLVRFSGHNNGAKEYLEEGKKNGRELTRDELDTRITLYGDLELTQKIYQSIPDNDQERYVSITHSYFEDDISVDVMKDIFYEYKNFLMCAYRDDEFNIYAEAHIPKIKYSEDKKTGELIERKPHVHIIIPEVNLLSGNLINPRGDYRVNEKYFEAVQEYINQKYNLISPRERVRANPKNVSDILSRYKGDDFRSKNREFKEQLVRDIVEENILSRKDFYTHVSSFGDIRIRNQGKENEYIAVKLPGDKKFTNLKETIFNDDFIVRRELKKPPLEKSVIQQLLHEWPQRAMELKYIDKANSDFRKKYYSSSQEEKIKILAQQETAFYQKYGERYDVFPAEWKTNHKSGINEAQTRGTTFSPNGLQSMSGGEMATGWQTGNTGSSLFLSTDALVFMGQSQSSGRDSGLRCDVHSGGRGRSGNQRGSGQPAITGTNATVHSRRSTRTQYGNRYAGGLLAGDVSIPVYARNKPGGATIQDVIRRSEILLRPPPGKSNISVNRFNGDIPQMGKNAAYVAAHFVRQYEQNKILPNQRQALWDIRQLYQSTRSFIWQDERLTRKERSQYLSILAFEHVKARQKIINSSQQENTMASEDIRKLIKKKPRLSNNEITGKDERKIPPAGKRFSRIVHTLKNRIEGEDKENSYAKSVSAADLYTRKSKLSKNVHYLDKNSNRTLFVDTGNAIAIRKDGMSPAALGIALELAKERFGSTLTIKGNEEFRNQVIDIVARNHPDLHFSDKAMNRQLEERRAEIAAERDGMTIEGVSKTSTSKEQEKEHEQAADTKNQTNVKESSEPHESPESRTVVKLEGKLIDHGKAPLDNKKGAEQSYFVTVRGRDGKETTHWDSDLQNVMKGKRRGTEISLELKESNPVQVSTRDHLGNLSIREAVRQTWTLNKMSVGQEQKREQSLEKIQQNQSPIPARTQTAVDLILANPVLRQMAMTAEQKEREFTALQADKESVREQTDQEIRNRLGSGDQSREPLAVILSDDELRGMALSMEQKMREMATPVDKLDAVKAEINSEIAARVAWNSSIPVPVSEVSATVAQKEIHREAESRGNKDKVHEGVLLDHGRAAYKFKPDISKPEDERDDSYFVKLKMDNGKTRTLWGVGLESAVAGYSKGERLRLEDKGTEKVQWIERMKDGREIEKNGDRRVWDCRSLTRESEVMKGFRVSGMPERDDGPDVA
ncbi:relaxase [Escherichia coli]|uniref:LPD7 domain-containing protein n=1 Tax=Escherichia coli TaxID=562 RepID=UPI00226435F5|nr:LPD7 domain-containing protein [Escherichia coli]ELX1534638.1 relaxase [Escherichia coli]MCX8416840.1 relaxase [Escherichia coli]